MIQYITPEFIQELNDNEVFVFGSNLAGRHGGGAARQAYECFGAEWGVGDGPTGQCYAIPTMQGGVETIKPYVDKFIEYANEHPEKRFLVTRIGCGIAGFRDSQIAPLFALAMGDTNISLPGEFAEELCIPSECWVRIDELAGLEDDFTDYDYVKLLDIAFDMAVHANCGEDTPELAYQISEKYPKEVEAVFDGSPDEVYAMLDDFLENSDYEDEVTGECHTFMEWSKIFYNADYNTLPALYDKCKALMEENNSLKKDED